MDEPLLPVSREVQLQPYRDVLSAHIDSEAELLDVPLHLLRPDDDRAEFEAITADW